VPGPYLLQNRRLVAVRSHGSGHHEVATGGFPLRVRAVIGHRELPGLDACHVEQIADQAIHAGGVALAPMGLRDHMFPVGGVRGLQRQAGGGVNDAAHQPAKVASAVGLRALGAQRRVGPLAFFCVFDRVGLFRHLSTAW